MTLIRLRRNLDIEKIMPQTCSKLRQLHQSTKLQTGTAQQIQNVIRTQVVIKSGTYLQDHSILPAQIRVFETENVLAHALQSDMRKCHLMFCNCILQTGSDVLIQFPDYRS